MLSSHDTNFLFPSIGLFYEIYYFLSSFLLGAMNLVTLDQDEISQCLPLEPGATTFFNLTFSGQLLDSLQDSDTLNWSCKLKILYSGGEAGVLGMSRQAAVDIKVEVLPSLFSTSYSSLHVGYVCK